ncbi:MAG: CRTAC1 family protein [Acidobacteriota bacterium]
MPFTNGAVAHVNQYKQGLFFSHDFVGNNSWNGYENNCLFSNVGDGRFVDVARPSGADGLLDGRGVATADFNGDGRLDLAINNNNSRPTLYLNRIADAGNWLQLALVGSTSNRDAVGAKVALTFGHRTLTRWVEAGSGYAAQSAYPLHFGLGQAEHVDAVEITWPSGEVVRLDGADVEVNRLLQVAETGEVVALATEAVVAEDAGAADSTVAGAIGG